MAGLYHQGVDIRCKQAKLLPQIQRKESMPSHHLQARSMRHTWMLALLAAHLSAWAQTVTEGPDHATQELGRPWDMSNQADIFPLLWTHNLAAATVANGVMTASARDSDPHFWLQFPPIPSAMQAINLTQSPIDANRYTHLTYMMWLPDSVDPGARVGRLVWHKGGSTVAEFDAAYSESPLFPVYPGWHLYQFDLAALQPLSGTRWTGAVQGLRIDPCLGCNVQFKIDWARLHHHNDASARFILPPGKAQLLAQITPSGSSTPVTLRLPTIADQASAAGLPPGSYHVAAVTDGDYALSQRGKPWAFDTREDLLWSMNFGIAAAQTGPGGLSGVTSNGDPSMQLDIPVHAPIDARKYRYLAIDLTLSQIPPLESGLLVWWGDQPGAVRYPSAFIPTRAGRFTYQIDLGQSPDWTGLIKALRIDPLNGPNAGSHIAFTLHSVRLTQASGFQETATFDTSRLTVNARPTVRILSPAMGDGEDYALVEQGRAWNMLQDQVRSPQLSNLRAWTYTSVIPDLNLTGTFFQGVSQPAQAGHTEGDPHVFLAFQENSHPIDANTYRWLSFDLFVPMDASLQSELTHGAMARVAWKTDDHDPGLTSDDIILMPGMQRYWLDMSKVAYEPASTRTWSGLVRYLRIDPFEFPESRSFFVGPVQLRATPAARHIVPVRLHLNDADGDTMSVKIKSGSTLLASATSLAPGEHQLFASLAALPAGEQRITVEVSDGRSTTVREAEMPILKLPLNAPLPPPQITAADRIFNWAESLLRGTVGAGMPSASTHACLQPIAGAYGRFYPSSNICLFTVDGLIVFTVNGAGLTIAGTTSELLEQAAAAGY